MDEKSKEISEDTFSLMRGLAENPWGMYAAQKCSRHVRVIEDAGWYDKRGKYVGSGDLSAKNVVDLAETLPEKELFIALTDKDSFRNFIRGTPEYYATFCGGGVPVTPPPHAEPGIEYITERAVLMIARGSVLMREELGRSYRGMVTDEIFSRFGKENRLPADAVQVVPNQLFPEAVSRRLSSLR